MEALFYFWQQFFSQPAKKPQGQAHQPRQLSGRIGPEPPQGPQQRRRRQQIQQHPRPGSQQQIQLRCHRLVALVAPAGEGGFQVGFAAGHGSQYIIHQVVAGAHRRLQQFIQGLIGTVGLGAAAQFVVLGGQVLGLAGAQAQGMDEPLQLGAVGYPLAVHYFV